MYELAHPRRDVLAGLICFASGLCVVFCFWPYRAGFLAYFVFVPFLIFSGLSDGRGRFVLNSFLFGFAYFIGSLYWIACLERDQITIPWLRMPAAAVLSLYLSLFIVLAGLLIRRVRSLGVNYEISAAVSWAAVEYLRSLGPLGFPWASIGYSQAQYTSIIQQAAVVGTYGLSAWLVLINGLVARAIVSRKPVVAAIAAAVFAVPVVAGRVNLMGSDGDRAVRLSLIQPNVSGSTKWDRAFQDSTMSLLHLMTLEAPRAGMVVWPETAVPFYIGHSREDLEGVRALAQVIGSFILFGYPDYEQDGTETKFYNSAMLIGPDGSEVGTYRKIHLVPFGEMIPFEDRISLLRRINLGEGDFSPGTQYTVFDVDGARFGVAICFESIYPSLVREFVRRGAEFIVNITNDEWFGLSLGPYQHAQMAVLRAVECNIGLARCANTGISMFVDPSGRVTEMSDLFEAETLTGDVVLGRGSSAYVRWGGYVENGLLLVVLVMSVAGSVRDRSRRSRPFKTD